MRDPSTAGPKGISTSWLDRRTSGAAGELSRPGWSVVASYVVADDACRSQGADLAEKFKRDRSAVKFIGVPTVHKISLDWSHAIWTWVARNATMLPIRFMAKY